MSFTLTQYFGGGLTLQPSAAFKLNWRNARLFRVEPQVASLVGKLANATRARPGVVIKIYNAGVHSFALQDFDGNTIATIASVSYWEVALISNGTAAGVWSARQL